MKKIFLYLIFTVSLFSADIPYRDMNVIIDKFVIQGDESIFSGKTINKYNSLGQLILVEKYNKNQSLYDKLSFQYNNLGLVSKTTFYKSDGKVDTYENKSYDTTGKLQKREVFRGGGVFYSLGTPIFDKSGNLEKMKEGDYKTGYIKEEYKYDGKGRKTLEIQYNSDGSIFSKFGFKYDGDFLSEKFDYYFTGEIKETTKYLYTTGFLTEKRVHNSSNELKTIDQIIYNKNGYPEKISNYEIILGYPVLRSYLTYKYQ